MRDLFDNPDYSDFLVAKTLNRVNEDGSKLPMFIDCLDSSGASSCRLVKVARHQQIDEKHLAAEMACSCLVAGLGLKVAEHRIVGFAEPYLAAINMTLAKLGYPSQLQPGWGTGAINTTGFQPIESATSYPKSLRSEASILYAFDLMSMHYDRLTHNPNCALLNGRLFVYDFDQCFPTITDPSPLYVDLRPWKVGAVDWRHSHIFREWLKAGLDKEAIHTAFLGWTNEWWSENRPKVPQEWEQTVDKIWLIAYQVVENIDRFIDQIEMSLG